MEKNRLLSDDDDEGNIEPIKSRKARRDFFTYTIYIFFGISLVVNILQYVRATTDARDFTIFPELQSLKRVVKTEHPEHGIAFSDFDGPSNNVSAKAWRALLQPFYFNISETELVAAGFSGGSSVRVKDGGYLASLAVYHELHCLNQFRNFLYIRTDPGKFTQGQKDYWQGHLTHCIEVLRLSLMCSADLSLYTFTWPEQQNFTFLDAHSKSPRKCVDWGQIEAWSLKRKISLTPTVIYPTDDGAAT